MRLPQVLSTLVIALAVSPAFAQGNVNFANAGVGLNARIAVVSYPGGEFLYYPAGRDFMAQLWVGRAGATEQQLHPAGAPAFFEPGIKGGYFIGSSRKLEGFPADIPVTAQVRVWNSAAGNTWDAALLASPANLLTGKSTLFSVTPTGLPMVPATLLDLKSFNVWSVAVPEPSMLSLLALGLIGIGVHSCRKRAN